MAEDGSPGAGIRSSVRVVRHAKAGDRRHWAEDDRERPLTKGGHRQAVAIAERLAGGAGAPARLVLLSSPAARCLQTLEPLAEIRRLPLETAPWLGEGEPAPEALERLMAAAAADPGAQVVACTHGDVIWGILELLARRRVPFDPPVLDAPKASVWVLELSDGDVESARLEPPPAAG